MEMIQFKHYPVMKNEAIEYLNINPDGIYCDLTLGGGSHSEEIAKRLRNGKLISIDKDKDAIDFSTEKLKDYKDKIHIVKDDFVNIKEILRNLKIEKIDGALIDLGISSWQIEADRGFSYIRDSILDMRMDRDQKLNAATVVNTFDKEKLKEILYTYGEERYSELIVREILKRREVKQIETTLELADIIKNAVRNVRYDGGHPAKRTFQAIRVYINREIEIIEPTIDAVESMLNSKGRLAVISFHSGEDRAVKKCFGKYEKNCECPPNFPVCVCNKRATSKIITRKPVYPSKKELEENSRSESAKLRVLEKL